MRTRSQSFHCIHGFKYYFVVFIRSSNAVVIIIVVVMNIDFVVTVFLCSRISSSSNIDTCTIIRISIINLK